MVQTNTESIQLWSCAAQWLYSQSIVSRLLQVMYDPTRFKHSRALAAHFGLTPGRFQSGVIDIEGRISRCGDRDVRSTLYTAANALMTADVHAGVSMSVCLSPTFLTVAASPGSGVASRTTTVAVSGTGPITRGQPWFTWSIRLMPGQIPTSNLKSTNERLKRSPDRILVI